MSKYHTPNSCPAGVVRINKTASTGFCFFALMLIFLFFFLEISNCVIVIHRKKNNNEGNKNKTKNSRIETKCSTAFTLLES